MVKSLFTVDWWSVKRMATTALKAKVNQMEQNTKGTELFQRRVIW